MDYRWAPVTPVTFNRLFPAGDPVDAETLVGSVDLAATAGQDLPYTVVNFISTADGHVTFQGRSGQLGDDGDRAMFHTLRERVDAVLAGTGTLSVERYGRILGKAERRERRVAAGRTPEALASVITRSGQIPFDIPLFAEPEARVVVFAPQRPDLDGVSAHVDWEAYDPAAPGPLRNALRTLRQDYGVSSLLCEGGPALFGSLLGEGLVDELFLTVAPKLAGGMSGPSVATGPPLPELAPMRIKWVLERNNALYLRYSLR